MHYGTLSGSGGIVKVVVISGGKPYQGSEKNGITSEPREPADRSFKVLGSLNDACKFFTERYSPSNIYANWQPMDTEKASGGPSDWTFI
jgi:hypothetical protein